MHWKKYKLLISGGIGCTLLAVAALVFLFRFKSEAGSASKRLDQAVRQVRSLKSAEVYPSATNLEVLAEHKLMLEQALVGKRQALVAQQVQAQPTDPSRFGIYASEFRQRLTDPKYVEIIHLAETSPSRSRSEPVGLDRDLVTFQEEDITHRVKVPPDFSFGFEEYVALGKRPSQQDIPRITVQMQLVERISTLLYQAGVEEMVDIQRETFELLPDEKDTIDTERDHDHLYRTELFQFSFKATEPALWQAMNLLATSSSDCFVLHTVSIQNLHPDPSLQPKDLEAQASSRARRSRSSARSARASSSGWAEGKEVVLPGKELVEAKLHIEAVLFVAPEAAEVETANDAFEERAQS